MARVVRPVGASCVAASLPDMGAHLRWRSVPDHRGIMTVRPASVSLASTFVHSADVLFQEVGGEAVLLDLASETYFGLNQVGTRVWQLLGDGCALQAIRDSLVIEYDASSGQIEADLLKLVTQLRDTGLVKAA